MAGSTGEVSCSRRIRTVLYDGEFTDGRLHGREYSLPAERCYVSGRTSERMRGMAGAEYRSPRGGFYVGDWKDNKRHGRGSLSCPMGLCMTNGCGDARHGKGTLDLPEGTSYRGTWVEDSFEGRGECISPDGSVYEGTWRAGKREGRGRGEVAERRELRRAVQGRQDRRAGGVALGEARSIIGGWWWRGAGVVGSCGIEGGSGARAPGRGGSTTWGCEAFLGGGIHLFRAGSRLASLSPRRRWRRPPGSLLLRLHLRHELFRSKSLAEQREPPGPSRGWSALLFL